MRHIFVTATALFALVFVFSGCEKNPEPMETGVFELSFIPRVSGQDFEMEFLYPNPNQRQYYFDEFKFYISDITLIKEDGSEVLLSEVELFNLRTELGKTTHGEGVYRQYDAEIGDYAGMRFGVGVPAGRNASDATSYADDHPMGVPSGMYWSWATGYRFIVLEGRVDSSASMSGTANYPIAYHTGLDGLYRELEVMDPFSISLNDELQFEMEIDVNRIFYNATDTLNMVTDNITHATPLGSPAYILAEKITDNFVNEALYKLPF